MGALPYRKTADTSRRAVEEHSGPGFGNHHEVARQDGRGALSDRGRRRKRSSALSCCNGKRKHRIDEFPLGEQDTPDRLLIPEKLYGRESRDRAPYSPPSTALSAERQAGAGACFAATPVSASPPSSMNSTKHLCRRADFSRPVSSTSTNATSPMRRSLRPFRASSVRLLGEERGRA